MQFQIMQRCIAVFCAAIMLSTATEVAANSHSQDGSNAVITTITDDLEQPWSLALLPSGEMLVTEKPGRLWRINSKGEKRAITVVPEVLHLRQGGLMEVILAPDFALSGRLFFTYAAGTDSDNRTTVASALLKQDRLVDVQRIVEVAPDKKGGFHFGGKLAFMADGSLLISVGEGYHYMQQAQRLDSELGKLLRVLPNGQPHPANPFPERAPRVFSYGHRNPQGLVVIQGTDDIFMLEHGPKGGDELNRIEAGRNYGWPAITYGIDYDGDIISDKTESPGMEQPLRYWVPSIAPSGLAHYTADLFPELKGSFLLGALKDRKLYALQRTANGIGEQSEPFPSVEGRVRDVRVHPDGSIYIVTDEGALLHIHK